MNIFIQWLLMILALTLLAFLTIKIKDLNNKQSTFLILVTSAIFLFIDTKGTIGVDKTIDIVINILMWVTIIVLSAICIFIQDIKKLAMVLFIPIIIFLFKLIQVVGTRLGM